ncbi:MAG: ISAs1 family transposase [Pseudonocardiales bacterium]|nr:ISAs1 family transposase [Pseudonocardiales bacterium]
MAADLWGTDLLVALSRVPDPRDSRGVRHRLVTVLAAAVCAVLAGARSYVGIAEWAHDLPMSVRLRLGIGRRAPSESTFRRVLQSVDAHALDTAVSSWLLERSAGERPANPTVRAVAVDGKTARGSRAPHQPARHLFAAFEQASGVVLGQVQVEDKGNEITAFAPLLDRIDPTNTVITADALHTQDRHATYLHERGGRYVFIVKNNRPKLRAQLAGLPWRDIPAVDLRQDKRHGRVESRTLKLAAIDSGILFPHARLAAQIVRRRRPNTSTATGTGHTETVYAVTDLGFGDIRPDQLADIIREGDRSDPGEGQPPERPVIFRRRQERISASVVVSR